MKTLKEHTIIYDDECPMCDLYTGAFVKTKMLDEKGRVPFRKIPDNISRHIDQRRACNQIALVNNTTGEVLYGLDSLLAVLGNHYPVFKPLFSLKAFTWLFEKLYSFISYNRKVIIPGKIFEGENSCTPDLHVGYRWAYISVAWLVTSFILTSYASLIASYLPSGNLGREFLVCAGQIVFQSVTVFFLRRERLLHYIGNMMTISLVGSLLLLPALIIGQLEIVQNELFYMLWFMSVVGLMFIEHMRRVKYLGIHWSASLSWVVYRFIVLIILLYLI